MTNSALYRVLVLAFVFLTISMLNVAYQHQLWREFWLNEFLLLVTALSLSVLLRRRNNS